MSIVFYSALLVYELGWVGFVSIGMIVVFTIVSQVMAIAAFAKFYSIYSNGDSRGKMVSEVINGIKMIKFNALERFVASRFRVLENKEMKDISSLLLYISFSESLMSLMPLVVSLVTFWMYSSSGKQLSIAQVYSIVTILNSIVEPIKYFKHALGDLIQAVINSNRYKTLLACSQFEEEKDDFDLKVGEILIEDGDFSWDNLKFKKIFEKAKIKKAGDENENDAEDRQRAALVEINLRIKPGELVAVIGKVGCGKTSLILAMIREMVKLKGRSAKNGKVALISQEAFLINDTIRNNIIFGEEYSSRRFKRVIKLCELEHDLDLLEGKEFTQIGENGINLSGGQKQRIAIARALYADADIYLIDDALSALDPQVGNSILENVFKKELRGKTRVIVTHKLNLLKNFDRVVVIKLGKIVADGTFNGIKETDEYRYLAEKSKNEWKAGKKDEEEIDLNTIKVFEQVSDLDDPKTGEKKLALNQSELEDKGKLNKEDQKQAGLVDFQIYKFYARSCGIGNIILLTFFTVLAVTIRIVGYLWLSLWMADKFKLSDLSLYPKIFIGLISGCFLMLFLKNIYFSRSFSRAAAFMFGGMISNILKRPIKFFDTTPSGQIVARFVDDITNCATELPVTFSFLMFDILIFFGGFIMVVTISPLLTIFLAVYGYFLGRSIKNYAKLSSDLERMVKLSKAPVITSLTELTKGIETIRAYNKLDFLMKIFKERFNTSMTCLVHKTNLVGYLQVRVKIGYVLLISFCIIILTVGKFYK